MFILLYIASLFGILQKDFTYMETKTTFILVLGLTLTK